MTSARSVIRASIAAVALMASAHAQPPESAAALDDRAVSVGRWEVSAVSGTPAEEASLSAEGELRWRRAVRVHPLDHGCPVRALSIVLKVAVDGPDDLPAILEVSGKHGVSAAA